MSPWRALLAFPIRPTAAADALRGYGAGLAALAAPAVVTGLYLAVKGCRLGDALAGAGAVAGAALGLGIGGAVGSMAALKIVHRPMRFLLSPCLAFAAWSMSLFTVALIVAKTLGMGATASVLSALIVLVWGVFAGIGVLGGESEAGRGLVASCLGTAGAVFGLLAAGIAVQGSLVMTLPALAETDTLHPGDLMLIRRDSDPAPGDLVLLRDAGSREVFLARVRADGEFEPVGGNRELWALGDWRPVGRVFFRVGMSTGADVVGPPRG